MNGMNDMGAQPKPLEQRGHSLEQCVPLAALGIPDEGEAMAEPMEGDQVSYTVEGKVTRIEGDKAYVMPSAVNGQAMETEAEQPPLDELAALQGDAEQLGQMY